LSLIHAKPILMGEGRV